MSTVPVIGAKKLRIPAYMAFVAALLLAGGCDAGLFVGPDGTLSERELRLTTSLDSHTFTDIGQRIQLSATTLTSSGDTVRDVRLDWSSDHPSIATVDSMGLVTARAAGTARIVVAALCCAVADTVAISVQADPVPQGTPGALHPNEPAGMTVVGQADGSIIQNTAGAFGIADAGGWYQNDPTAISIVSDPENPTGSGQALRFDYADGKWPGKMDIDFSAGPFNQLYVLQRIKFLSGGGWEAFSPKNYYLRVEGSSEWGKNTWTNFNGADPRGKAPGVVDGHDGNLHAVYKGNTEAALVYDEFVTLEYLFVAESSPGAGDGQVHCWVDGVLIFSSTVMRHNLDGVGARFAGLHYYAKANTVATPSSYVLREFYVSGK